MKTMFSSFRNAFLSILCAIVVLAIVGIGITYAAKAGGKKTLDRNAALERALADAGVSASDITITRQKLNQENGKNCYEIAFFSDAYEYEYEIDAATGDVVGVSIEAVFDKQAVLTDNAGGNLGGNAVPEGGTPGRPDGSGSSDNRQTDSQSSDDQQSASRPSDTASGQSGNPAGQSQDSSQDGRIGLAAAKDKALSDAGLSSSDVTFTKSRLDLDDGVYVYEIEFYTASTEYEYEINAATGAIVDKSVEAFQSHNSPGAHDTHGTTGATGATGTTGTTGTTGNSGSYIGTDRAKEIAASDAGVKVSDATFTKSELDLDDGVYIYEIEFYTGSAEYEYEINAATGAIIDKDMEAFRTVGASETSGNTGSYIGVDRAKEIAVKHAGLGITEVIFTKTKVEREDGCTQYEIEFCKGSSEYEYCIDAFSGSILEYDCEHDDDHHDEEHHGHALP